METVVYLVRHAAYESPRPVLPVRLPGFHLSEGGRETAKKIAEFFSKKDIAAIYSSPLERTRETAEIIAEKIHKDVTIDDRLLEIRSPTQGKPEGYSASMAGWKMYETEWYKKEGGESPEEIYSRMNACVKEKVIEHRGQEIIIVSHGDPIMILVGGLQGKKLISPEVEALDYIQMGSFLVLTFDAHDTFLTSKSPTP